jgi:uncharacterized protein (AIM24 family)
MPLNGTETMMVQSGSWLASDTTVDIDTKWGGAKTFFSGEGLFLLKCTGQGDMLVSSYGAIVDKTLQAARSTRSTPVTSSPSKKASVTR